MQKYFKQPSLKIDIENPKFSDRLNQLETRLQDYQFPSQEQINEIILGN